MEYDGDGIKIRDYLKHHGVKGMEWGVHNDETKRKYGELPPKTHRRSKEGGAETDRGGDSNGSIPKAVASEIVGHVKKKYTDKREAEIRQKEEAAAKEKRDEEIKSKYGITAEKYNALRNAALNSNDPRVVAKGMQFLSDDELRAKINRLEQESRIKDLSNKQRKEAASVRKSELEARQNTIPYRLGKLVVESARNQILNPMLGQARKRISSSLDSAGKKAVESLRKKSGLAAVNDSKQEVTNSVSQVKDSAVDMAYQQQAAKQQRIEESKQKKH